jgi:replication factor C subunit 1
MSVCFKENVKISAEVIDQIIVGCNYDIRQCLHNLSMWSSNNKLLNSSLKTDIEKAIKDTKMNPFEACKQVFQSDQSGNKPRNMIEKMDFFFTDYSLMPLLIQENYLSIKPFNLKGNTKQQKDRYHLELLNEAAQSMCISDRIGRQIRTNNNWSLLTTQAVFATVIPGEKLSGSIGLPAFPGWFGKNSKQGRVDRILQELQKHMRLHISANKIGVGMEYLSVLKRMLSDPLVKKGTEGISEVIKIMNEYCLTRDDFDTILELSTWPGQKDPSTMIDSKVKAAFTRAYNKESHKNPFTIVNIKKLKASKLNEEGEEENEDAEEEEDSDDIAADSMIKMGKTKKTTAVSSTSKAINSKAGATKRAANESEAVAKPSASKKKKT